MIFGNLLELRSENIDEHLFLLLHEIYLPIKKLIVFLPGNFPIIYHIILLLDFDFSIHDKVSVLGVIISCVYGLAGQVLLQLERPGQVPVLEVREAEVRILKQVKVLHIPNQVVQLFLSSQPRLFLYCNFY